MKSEKEIRDKIKYWETELEVLLADKKMERREFALKSQALLSYMSAAYWVLGESLPRVRNFTTGERSF